jgi:hypothetical protein
MESERLNGIEDKISHLTAAIGVVVDILQKHSAGIADILEAVTAEPEEGNLERVLAELVVLTEAMSSKLDMLLEKADARQPLPH